MNTIPKALLGVLLAILLGACDDGNGETDPDSSTTDAIPETIGDSTGDPAVDTAADTAGDPTGDPCAGVTCCDHGTCTAESGSAVCECDPGWAPDLTDPLCCVGCKQSGDTCTLDLHCCWAVTVGCIIESGETEGYCSMECQEHIHCHNFSDDGATMCCEPDGDSGYCVKSEVACE